jgi:predicted kinase
MEQLSKAGECLDAKALCMATAYVMVGFAGAGKTTLARRLAAEKGAIRFTPDEWMESLFADSLPHDDFSLFFGRVCSLVWDVASQLLLQGQDVVLDIGFWTFESREHARARIAQLGAKAELIFVDCDEDLLIERLMNRRSVLWSSPEIVRERLSTFERPRQDEVHSVVDTNS